MGGSELGRIADVGSDTVAGGEELVDHVATDVAACAEHGHAQDLVRGHGWSSSFRI